LSKDVDVEHHVITERKFLLSSKLAHGKMLRHNRDSHKQTNSSLNVPFFHTTTTNVSTVTTVAWMTMNGYHHGLPSTPAPKPG
jgi:hypothetical protein